MFDAIEKQGHIWVDRPIMYLPYMFLYFDAMAWYGEFDGEAVWCDWDLDRTAINPATGYRYPYYTPKFWG